MKITLDKNTLLQPLSKVVSITEKRSLMPILSNILIHFKKDMTIIYSTDLEISAIISLNLLSEEEKRVVVHGKKLLEVLRELDNGDIVLEFKDNIMNLTQKNTDITLSLQDPEEFPETKEIEKGNGFFIKGKQLLEMIGKVSFAVSLDETRYILTGMHLKGNDGNMVVVGTDGFRMALFQKEIAEMKSFQGITIPKRSLSEIEKIISEEDDVNVVIDEKHVQFSTERIKIISRTMEGNFPEYENVLPAGNTNMAVVQREEFLKGLKKVSAIIGRSEPVRITLGDNMMVIEAESDIGRAKEVINIGYEGEETNMNFNVRFLLEVVNRVGGETMVLAAPKTYGAVLFTGEDSNEYKNIVMPIRI